MTKKLAIDFLSDNLRQYISRQGWSRFTQIQSAAIENIVSRPDNFILAARTASGKTEAAFLPAIDLVSNWQGSVGILYISPLIALINDQFERIESLCSDNDIRITKWHGEASLSAKKSLVQRPEGILFITPESIEAMFINRPGYMPQLFNQLQFIIVDEIHSFLGVDRGRHLRSLLHRLQAFSKTPARFIGLSATINPQSYDLVKDYYSNGRPTHIIRDSSSNPVQQTVSYQKTDGGVLAPELIDEIYHQTQDRKALIFPNSRGRVEEIAVGLKRRSEKSESGHGNYYAHHSSVDRQLREDAERFAKQSNSRNFAIICTSTLELGIDIGSVDTVIQVDSTSSVSSLVQRLGRSGRRQDQSSQLLVYTTGGWSLLRAIACIELHKVGFVEPAETDSYPANVFLHQVLSIIRQHSGRTRDEILTGFGANNPIARSIPVEEQRAIIDQLVDDNLLEELGKELIIGSEGEVITTRLDFYSLFSSRSDFNVFHGNRRIGELQWNPTLKVDDRIFLAAKIWQITSINPKTRRVGVLPAPSGKKPSFRGAGAVTHPQVYQQMRDILLSDEDYGYLDNSAKDKLSDLRRELEILRSNPSPGFCPILGSGNQQLWYTFTGTKVFETLRLVLDNYYGLDIVGHPGASRFEVVGSRGHLESKLDSLIKQGVNNKLVYDIISKLIADGKSQILDDKFASFLPLEAHIKQIVYSRLDIDGVNEFLSSLQFRLPQ